ncbi:MAG: hypothetical protein KAZ88_09605 [Acidimicrobiia bacterium]|nr:hypothetical protein [Acidimicrobiia bacterium]MBP8181235.1 hypothetical protein [Acidimicrobiia bacterium]
MFGRRRTESRPNSDRDRAARLAEVFEQHRWVAPAWADRGDETRHEAVGSAPWSVDGAGATRTATVGAVGEPDCIEIDESGVATVLGAQWCIEWWIRTQAGWIRPAGRAGVRQSRIGGTPLLETRLSIGSGDDVTTQVGAVTGPAALATMEFRNHSDAPVAVALIVRPFTLSGLGRIKSVGVDGRYVTIDGRRAVQIPAAPSDVRVGVGGVDSARQLMDQDETASPSKVEFAADQSCEFGLANIAVVFPLNHVEARTVVIARDPEGSLPEVAQPAAVPDMAALERGWSAQTGQGVSLRSAEQTWTDAWPVLKLCTLSTARSAGIDLDAIAAGQAGLTDMADARSGLRGDAFAETIGAYADWWCWSAGLTDAGLGRYCDELLVGVPSIQRKSGAFDAVDPNAATAVVTAAIARRLVLSPNAPLAEALEMNLVTAVHDLERAAKKTLPAEVLTAMAAAARWLALLWSPAGEAVPGTEDDQKGSDMAALAADWQVRIDPAAITSPFARWIGLDGGVLNPADIGPSVTARELGDAPWVTLVGGTRSAWGTAVLAASELAAGRGDATARLTELLAVGRDVRTWPTTLHPSRTAAAGGVGDDQVVLAIICSAIRTALTRVTAAGSRGAVAASPILPSAWLGAPQGIRHVPVPGGAVSWEVRWHDDRPAILWESAGADFPALTAPGLDSGWSAQAANGEALLAQNDLLTALMRDVDRPQAIDIPDPDSTAGTDDGSVGHDGEAHSEPDGSSRGHDIDPPSSFI